MVNSIHTCSQQNDSPSNICWSRLLHWWQRWDWCTSGQPLQYLATEQTYKGLLYTLNSFSVISPQVKVHQHNFVTA